jgi:hypothetical protein
VANIFIVVNETIGPNETAPETLTPSIRCRNCKREVSSRADFECCSACALYYMGKWCIQQ